MKKLVFMFVAMAAISFASCGNKAEALYNYSSFSIRALTLDKVSGVICR